MAHIKTVLELLRKEKLKVNLKKCEFFAQEVHFLGHIVSKAWHYTSANTCQWYWARILQYCRVGIGRRRPIPAANGRQYIGRRLDIVSCRSVPILRQYCSDILCLGGGALAGNIGVRYWSRRAESSARLALGFMLSNPKNIGRVGNM